MGKALILTVFLVFFSRFVFASDWMNRGGTINTELKKSKKNWQQLGETKNEAVKQLIEIINTSEIGRSIVFEAQKKAGRSRYRLEEIVGVGEASITDTTLIRKFSPTDPFSISYTSESKIFLDKSLDVKNAVLDLVHELTHYAYKDDFNPYKENFSLTSFVKDTIEAKGGEADAFLVECRVSRAVFGEGANSSQCNSIVSLEGVFSKELAINEFYKIGNFFDKFEEKISQNGLTLDKFPNISKDNGVLVSSAWSRPYPMAAVEEYDLIMSRVCENDLKRMAVLGESIGRSPASEKINYAKAKMNIAMRCSEIHKRNTL